MKTTRLGILVTLGLAAAGAAALAQAPPWSARQVLEFSERMCRAGEQFAAIADGVAVGRVEQSALEFNGLKIGRRYRIPLDAGALLEFDRVVRGGRASRFVGSLFDRYGDPRVLIALDGDCRLEVARRLRYDDRGQALGIETLDAGLEPRGEFEWINPPLEFVERPAPESPAAAPVRVGMVDSGVNYRLPEINRRLARDADGELVGFDFWDMDGQPYDAHPVNTGFFLQRHGTRTASLLLREAPGIELVPYRYPRPDMSRMEALVEHAAEHGVSIVGMPLGSNDSEDWIGFEIAARAHPRILFIASAGNDGRDIDARPVYPAALGLDNMVVVTSADDFAGPAERTNWGRISVDYLVPAERIPALDYSGREIPVSGSSYAVARAAALAARLKQANPAWTAADIVAEFRRRYGDVAPEARRWVSVGYIGDPLAGAALRFDALPAPAPAPAIDAAEYVLPLDILVLEPRWSIAAIEGTLRRAFAILAQCAIAPGAIAARALDGDDYLRDLSTGTALTVLAAAGGGRTTVVFARDSRMQAQFGGEAFGLGNTRTRPWLADSVWLMLGVDDPGVALAHELFHVLANSGAHIEGVANLMQGNTSPDSTELTPAQCGEAQRTGSSHLLLQKAEQ